MTYRVTKSARTDLKNISRFTRGRWGPEQQKVYITGLLQQFERLSQHPFIGRSRPEIGHDIRSIVHDSHVVFYRPHRDQIEILRVLHGKQDVIKAFTTDESL